MKLVSKFLSFLPSWRWKEQKYFLSNDRNSYTWLRKRELFTSWYMHYLHYVQSVPNSYSSSLFSFFFPPEDYTPVVLYFVDILFYFYFKYCGRGEGMREQSTTIYHLFAGDLLCFGIQILLFNIVTCLSVGLLIITAGKLESPSNNDWDFFLQLFLFCRALYCRWINRSLANRAVDQVGCLS